jgi:hypothetical protein
MPFSPLFIDVAQELVFGIRLSDFPNRRAFYGGYVFRLLIAKPAIGALVALAWVIPSQGYDPINITIGTLYGSILGAVAGVAGGAAISRIPTYPFLCLAFFFPLLGMALLELVRWLKPWDYRIPAGILVHLATVAIVTRLVARHYQPEP